MKPTPAPNPLMEEYEAACKKAEAARERAHELLCLLNETRQDLARAQDWARIAGATVETMRRHLTADGVLAPPVAVLVTMGGNTGEPLVIEVTTGEGDSNR